MPSCSITAVARPTRSAGCCCTLSTGNAGEPAARRRDLQRAQLANFWQDVAIDWQKDRVYLPQADLARFGIEEAQIAAGRCDANWAALIDFEVGAHARELMLAGAPLVHELPGRMGWGNLVHGPGRPAHP